MNNLFKCFCVMIMSVEVYISNIPITMMGGFGLIAAALIDNDKN